MRVKLKHLCSLLEQVDKTGMNYIRLHKEDIRALVDENQRLREALEAIEDGHCGCCSISEGYSCDCQSRIAKAALEGK